jgi:Ca2+-binding RTX toxin-like protein
MRRIVTQSACQNWFSLTFGDAVDGLPFGLRVLLGGLSIGYEDALQGAMGEDARQGAMGEDALQGAMGEDALQDVLGEDGCVRPRHDVQPGRFQDEIHALDLLSLVLSSYGL